MLDILSTIKESNCFELEVTDAWQLPAIYKIYKKGVDVNINELCFSKELEEDEYSKFIEKVLEYNIDKWEDNYSLAAGEKEEEKYTWKLTIHYSDGKKIIKRGTNTGPEEFADLEEYLIEITE